MVACSLPDTTECVRHTKPLGVCVRCTHPRYVRNVDPTFLILFFFSGIQKKVLKKRINIKVVLEHCNAQIHSLRMHRLYIPG